MSTGVPTPILGLNTFENTDAFLQAEVDANSTQLDTLPPTVCTSAARPTTNLYQGRYIWESDTKTLLMYDKSTTTWIPVSKTKDTGWLTCTPTAGWTHSGGATLVARQVGDRVFYQGGLVNAGFSGGFSVAANMPVGIGYPTTVVAGSVASGANVVRGLQVGTGGTIELYSAAANGSSFYLGGSYIV